MNAEARLITDLKSVTIALDTQRRTALQAIGAACTQEE